MSRPKGLRCIPRHQRPPRCCQVQSQLCGAHPSRPTASVEEKRRTLRRTGGVAEEGNPCPPACCLELLSLEFQAHLRLKVWSVVDNSQTARSRSGLVRTGGESRPHVACEHVCSRPLFQPGLGRRAAGIVALMQNALPSPLC